jgi:hypothetical protein
MTHWAIIEHRVQDAAGGSPRCSRCQQGELLFEHDQRANASGSQPSEREPGCWRCRSSNKSEGAMGRYYFHFQSGDKLISDEEGIDFLDYTAAYREAVQSVRELLADAIKADDMRVPDALVISDETGKSLDTIPMADVLPKSIGRR